MPLFGTKPRLVPVMSEFAAFINNYQNGHVSTFKIKDGYVGGYGDLSGVEFAVSLSSKKRGVALQTLTKNLDTIMGFVSRAALKISGELCDNPDTYHTIQGAFPTIFPVCQAEKILKLYREHKDELIDFLHTFLVHIYPFLDAMDSSGFDNFHGSQGYDLLPAEGHFSHFIADHARHSLSWDCFREHLSGLVARVLEELCAGIQTQRLPFDYFPAHGTSSISRLNRLWQLATVNSGWKRFGEIHEDIRMVNRVRHDKQFKAISALRKFAVCGNSTGSSLCYDIFWNIFSRSVWDQPSVPEYYVVLPCAQHPTHFVRLIGQTSIPKLVQFDGVTLPDKDYTPFLINYQRRHGIPLARMCKFLFDFGSIFFKHTRWFPTENIAFLTRRFHKYHETDLIGRWNSYNIPRFMQLIRDHGDWLWAKTVVAMQRNGYAVRRLGVFGYKSRSVSFCEAIEEHSMQRFKWCSEQLSGKRLSDVFANMNISQLDADAVIEGEPEHPTHLQCREGGVSDCSCRRNRHIHLNNELETRELILALSRGGYKQEVTQDMAHGLLLLFSVARYLLLIDYHVSRISCLDVYAESRSFDGAEEGEHPDHYEPPGHNPLAEFDREEFEAFYM